MDREVERSLLHSNYRVDVRPRITNDISANLRNFPGLRVNLTTMHEGGQAYKVCTLEGYISTTYQNRSYSIPIDCLIPYRYPNTNPIVYVRNPANTSIQASIYLDADGLVIHPVLVHWDPRKSSLSNALHDIAVGFSQHFPIVSGAPAPVYRTSQASSISSARSEGAHSAPRNFTMDPNNYNHQVYFGFEAEEREIEARISRVIGDISSTPMDPNVYLKDLKQMYYDLFMIGRKKEKAVLVLSKLS